MLQVSSLDFVEVKAPHMITPIKAQLIPRYCLDNEFCTVLKYISCADFTIHLGIISLLQTLQSELYSISLQKTWNNCLQEQIGAQQFPIYDSWAQGLSLALSCVAR
jgi:hypothetical protein